MDTNAVKVKLWNLDVGYLSWDKIELDIDPALSSSIKADFIQMRNSK